MRAPAHVRVRADVGSGVRVRACESGCGHTSVCACTGAAVGSILRDLRLAVCCFVQTPSLNKVGRRNPGVLQVGSIFNKVFETTFTGDWHAEDQIFEPESRKPSTVAVRASMDISALARQLQYNIAPTAARAISNKCVCSPVLFPCTYTLTCACLEHNACR